VIRLFCRSYDKDNQLFKDLSDISLLMQNRAKDGCYSDREPNITEDPLIDNDVKIGTTKIDF
jgi:hypothetical protein